MHTRQASCTLARLLKVFLGTSLSALATLAHADPATPPLERLYSADARLISGELVEINPAGRLVFKRLHVFGNTSGVPDHVDAAITTRAFENAKLGEHYIVGYTTFQNDKQYPAGITPSRKDTVVISSSGLDPALFLDSPELRKILDIAATERGRESTKLRQILLKTFDGNEPRLQRLAAAQLALDSEMSDKLSGKDKIILREAALNEHINPTTRSLLITAAADRPDDFGGWAGEAINKILEITPVDGYPSRAEDHTGLILLSFDEASARKIQIPFQSLVRWLRSSHQLYLERASTLLDSLYPERRESAFGTALGESDPNSATHQFLNRKLREIDQKDVRTDAQSH